VWFVEESFRQGRALVEIRLVLAIVFGSSATPAGQQRRILGYPEGDILTFGPRIAESLDRLIADLYR
jgi:ABC-type hemin transport system substrate-binding protein